MKKMKDTKELIEYVLANPDNHGVTVFSNGPEEHYFSIKGEKVMFSHGSQVGVRYITQALGIKDE